MESTFLAKLRVYLLDGRRLRNLDSWELVVIAVLTALPGIVRNPRSRIAFNTQAKDTKTSVHDKCTSATKDSSGLIRHPLGQIR
jgi:hypothetical protein